MTLSATTRKATYTGNGVTTTFAVPFGFFEIEVYLDSTLKTEVTHYTITQSSPGATGSITFLVAPASDVRVTIIGATELSQEVDFTNNDALPAETLERALDKAMAAVAELSVLLEQTIRVPITQSAPAELDLENNTNKFIFVDADGEFAFGDLVGPDPETSITADLIADATTVGKELIRAANAAAARTAIGAAASSHTHTASEISDSTAVGRALLTAASADAAKATLAFVDLYAFNSLR